MPPPLQVDFRPFDLESGVRVTCDVGYLCAILVFLGLYEYTFVIGGANTAVDCGQCKSFKSEI